jgi:hypothetical protein
MAKAVSHVAWMAGGDGNITFCAQGRRKGDIDEIIDLFK